MNILNLIKEYAVDDKRKANIAIQDGGETTYYNIPERIDNELTRKYAAKISNDWSSYGINDITDYYTHQHVVIDINGIIPLTEYLNRHNITIDSLKLIHTGATKRKFLDSKYEVFDEKLIDEIVNIIAKLCRDLDIVTNSTYQPCYILKQENCYIATKHRVDAIVDNIKIHLPKLVLDDIHRYVFLAQFMNYVHNDGLFKKIFPDLTVYGVNDNIDECVYVSNIVNYKISNVQWYGGTFNRIRHSKLYCRSISKSSVNKSNQPKVKLLVSELRIRGKKVTSKIQSLTRLHNLHNIKQNDRNPYMTKLINYINQHHARINRDNKKNAELDELIEARRAIVYSDSKFDPRKFTLDDNYNKLKILFDQLIIRKEISSKGLSDIQTFITVVQIIKKISIGDNSDRYYELLKNSVRKIGVNFGDDQINGIWSNSNAMINVPGSRCLLYLIIKSFDEMTFYTMIEKDPVARIAFDRNIEVKNSAPLAEIAIQHFGKRFLAVPLKQYGKNDCYMWYYFNGVRWEHDNMTVINRIVYELSAVLRIAKDAVSAINSVIKGAISVNGINGNDLNLQFQSVKTEMIIKEISTAISTVENHSKRSNLLADFAMKIIQSGDMTKRLNKVNKIAMENCVFNADTFEIEWEGNPDDYITMSTRNTYEPFNSSEEIKRDFKEFIERLYDAFTYVGPDGYVDDKETRDRVNLFIYFIASTLSMTKDREKALLLLSPGGSMKTVLQETLDFMLGDYVDKLNFSYLYQKSLQNNSGIDEQLAALENKRLANMAEYDAYSPIAIDRFKTLTGETKFSARKIFENQKTIDIYTKLLMTANHHPRIEEWDDSIMRRLVVIEISKRYKKGVSEDTEFVGKAIEMTSQDKQRYGRALLSYSIGLLQKHPHVSIELITPRSSIQSLIRYRCMFDKYYEFMIDKLEFLDVTPDGVGKFRKKTEFTDNDLEVNIRKEAITIDSVTKSLEQIPKNTRIPDKSTWNKPGSNTYTVKTVIKILKTWYIKKYGFESKSELNRLADVNRFKTYFKKERPSNYIDDYELFIGLKIKGEKKNSEE